METDFCNSLRPQVSLVSLITVEAYPVTMLPDSLVQPFRRGILQGTALKRPRPCGETVSVGGGGIYRDQIKTIGSCSAPT